MSEQHQLVGGGFATEREVKAQQIENSFSYHKPFGTQPERYERLRDAFKNLALLLNDLTPTSREQAVALTRLEEASMWANKAIACNEGEVASPQQQAA